LIHDQNSPVTPHTSAAMSTEPPTGAKVVIHTNKGPIEVELWTKEAPKACRNFLQLIMEGYYEGTIFHRVEPGFLVQGGDPSGTGQGGESCWGEPFHDEVHSRLRFTHRGILAMASAQPNSNGSQFFFTLDRCQWLDRKHTIFGKIVGDTIYNLLTIAEGEIGENNRPVHPCHITSCSIIINPFDDIAPRAIIPKAQAVTSVSAKDEGKKEKLGAATAVRNSGLLSFGDDVDESEENAVQNVLAGKKRKSAAVEIDISAFSQLGKNGKETEQRRRPLPVVTRPKGRPPPISGSSQEAMLRQMLHVSHTESKMSAPSVTSDHPSNVEEEAAVTAVPESTPSLVSPEDALYSSLSRRMTTKRGSNSSRTSRISTYRGKKSKHGSDAQILAQLTSFEASLSSSSAAVIPHALVLKDEKCTRDPSLDDNEDDDWTIIDPLREAHQQSGIPPQRD
jgi:cyclophilin family peptidyl-prolyl cis-trans isomerase